VTTIYSISWLEYPQSGRQIRPVIRCSSISGGSSSLAGSGPPGTGSALPPVSLSTVQRFMVHTGREGRGKILSTIAFYATVQPVRIQGRGSGRPSSSWAVVHHLPVWKIFSYYGRG